MIAAMEINVTEQYRRADIIIDAICSVGGINYGDLVVRSRSVRMNTLRGVCCLMSWEYGVHPKRLAELIRRSRSNVINQTNRYRKWMSTGDKITVEVYRRVKKIVLSII